MAFKFGLKSKIANAPTKSALAKPALAKKKPLFDDEEEEPKCKAKQADSGEEIAEFNFDDTLASSSSKAEKPAPKVKPKSTPTEPPKRKALAREDDPTRVANLASMKEAERRAKEAEEVDASIYDYDAAYEVIHARQLAKKAAEREEAAELKPKYMESLFESAEQRKKDQLRARDKLLQRERVAEGDEFADKEKFVTGAYKLQQEEARKAEEEEKKRLATEEEKRRKFGMQGFHKQMLMEEEKRHQEAMEAAAEAAKTGVKVVEEPKNKTEAELVAELRAQGKDVRLNDEGQVADKRDLLPPGLNIMAKPKKASTAAPTEAKPAGPPTSFQGRNAARHDMRVRHTQMVAQQIEAAAKRKADEKAEEASKLQHASKSQKTASDISSAKERYLQRKREAAAAKAAAEGK
ncbi:hypothetical protein BU23DRAFT_558473 [Bimuria novae-zelandiae CBS 107.79]|uniref:Nuclear speckle splicing regulatory protein 1 N-terminal domain-containing protein n=1 Tax=Bimuria novae-zelandiae CBS 107.79 TaxID=1447943 RepID=A0A6A5UTX7_9PLEO|nr:hypothetical protein BU23DRAFT_558473 [Bimuria novae-zelandiae CBS 107.79]